jgi:hypothetical protein
LNPRQLLKISHHAILLVLAGLAAITAAPASAQGQTGFTMNARPAFDGNFKYGEWLPVMVEMENSGPDLDGEVQVRVTGRGAASVFSTPVSMPTSSRKLITLYVLPNNFSHALSVQFISGNTAIASQSITVRAQPNITYVIGIVSPERGALSMLMSAQFPGASRKITLVDFNLSEIPDRPEGLRSFDTIIINSVDSSILSPQQKTALETWVRQGGRLVIGGGAGAMQTVSGLPADLLPVSVRSFEELDSVAGLESLADGEIIRVPGPFVAATGNNLTGRVLAGDQSFPLVIEKTVGAGNVDLVALDLSASPFDAWAGTTTFWERLLGPTAAYPDGLPPDMSARQMASNQMIYALSNLPALDLPSIRSLTLLLGIYVGLVGPVNYLILRWKRRMHWAWVTIPLITAVFSTGAFSIGYAMRGSDLLLNKVQVAELQPGGIASVRSYFGLFSPTQTSYEIEVLGGGLVSQLTADYDPWSFQPTGGGEVYLVQGEPNRLRGLTVNQWSMQSFMTEAIWTGSGEIISELVMEGLTLTGTIRNNTDYDISEAVLILGNNISKIGFLGAGEDKQISMQVGDLVGQVFGPSLSYRILEDEYNRPNPTGPSRQLQLKQSVLDSLFPSGYSLSSMRTSQSEMSGIQLYLLGWFDSQQDEIRVSNRVPVQQTTGVIYTRLPYHLADEGRLTLPPGLIPGTMIQSPLDGGSCGIGGTASVYLIRGDAVFEFQVPAQYSDIRIENLLLYLGTEGGWMRAPEPAIYDWETESWLGLENASTGTNKIAFQDEFLNSNQSVRIRLQPNEGFSGGCTFLGLGLEGDR